MDNDFNIYEKIEKYESLYKKADGLFNEDYYQVKDKLYYLKNIMNELDVLYTPCHNDTIAENFIKSSENKMYLIDWEYAGMNDPMWDIAALFLESNFTDESKDYFLSHYFDGNEPENARKKILVYQILMDYLWAVWTCIKEAQGDDFGTYGMDRYTRAIENLKKIDL